MTPLSFDLTLCRHIFLALISLHAWGFVLIGALLTFMVTVSVTFPWAWEPRTGAWALDTCEAAAPRGLVTSGAEMDHSCFRGSLDSIHLKKIDCILERF